MVNRLHPLTSAAVVRAAVQLADDRGIDAVTMRGLGAQVGVGAMALYHYVTGRDALLDAMIADLLDQLTPQLRPPASACASGPGPYLERSARAVRRVALAHPWLIRLIVNRPSLDSTRSASLANPAALACTDLVLSALADHYDDDVASVRAFRSFCAFLLGHLLLEIPLPRGRTDSPGRYQVPPLSPTRHAQVLTRLARATSIEPDVDFDRALRAFLSTLDRQRDLDQPVAAQLPASTARPSTREQEMQP